MSDDPISGLPCWMTSYPVLREMPSDLNNISIVSHPVDHLENGGNIYTSGVQSTKYPFLSRLFRGEYSLYIRAKLTSAVSHHDSYIGFCCVY